MAGAGAEDQYQGAFLLSKFGAIEPRPRQISSSSTVEDINLTKKSPEELWALYNDVEEWVKLDSANKAILFSRCFLALLDRLQKNGLPELNGRELSLVVTSYVIGRMPVIPGEDLWLGVYKPSEEKIPFDQRVNVCFGLAKDWQNIVKQLNVAARILFNGFLQRNLSSERRAALSPGVQKEIGQSHQIDFSLDTELGRVFIGAAADFIYHVADHELSAKLMQGALEGRIGEVKISETESSAMAEILLIQKSVARRLGLIQPDSTSFAYRLRWRLGLKHPAVGSLLVDHSILGRDLGELQIRELKLLNKIYKREIGTDFDYNYQHYHQLFELRRYFDEIMAEIHSGKGYTDILRVKILLYGNILYELAKLGDDQFAVVRNLQSSNPPVNPLLFVCLEKLRKELKEIYIRLDPEAKVVFRLDNLLFEFYQAGECLAKIRRHVELCSDSGLSSLSDHVNLLHATSWYWQVRNTIVSLTDEEFDTLCQRGVEWRKMDGKTSQAILQQRFKTLQDLEVIVPQFPPTSFAVQKAAFVRTMGGSLNLNLTVDELQSSISYIEGLGRFGIIARWQKTDLSYGQSLREFAPIDKCIQAWVDDVHNSNVKTVILHYAAAK